MHQYRITKYDPAFRDASGAYQRSEWTSISDIGKTFPDGVLTPTDYQRVEDAYVTAALSFLSEAGCVSLKVVDL